MSSFASSNWGKTQKYLKWIFFSIESNSVILNLACAKIIEYVFQILAAF
jgi:hypothetical protein